MQKGYKEIPLVVCRGIGQVFFQGNALSGLLMLIGIAVSSIPMALLAIAGNIVGNATAYVARFDRDDIAAGLYGFNGTLVGIAMGVFMELSPSAFLFLIAASALSTFIARLIGLQKLLPGLTTPFIIATWVMLAAAPASLLAASQPVSISETSIDWLEAMSFSFGQVMFQGSSVATGVLFLIGIAINSRINAVYALIGAIASVIFAMAIGVGNESINLGLMGYNGILCAIAIGKRTYGSLIFAIVATIASVALQCAGTACGITTLTAPFVAATWLTLLLRQLIPLK